MLEANLTLLVYDEHGRHPSQLEQVDLLVVQVGNRVLRVSQAGELKTLLLPRAHERAWAIGADGEHLGVTRNELVVILAQLRQMPAAVRSGEPARKDEHNMFLAAIV